MKAPTGPNRTGRFPRRFSPLLRTDDPKKAPFFFAAAETSVL